MARLIIGRIGSAGHGAPRVANYRWPSFASRTTRSEFWFGANPRDQLQLDWLLDHLGSFPVLAQKFGVRLLDSDLFFAPDDDFAESEPHIPVVNAAAEEFETGTAVWSAYRAPTPEACMDLLRCDLSALLMLRPALLNLLAELPSPSTGLGAQDLVRPRCDFWRCLREGLPTPMA